MDPNSHPVGTDGRMLRAVMLVAIACGLVAIFFLLLDRPADTAATGGKIPSQKNTTANTNPGPWSKARVGDPRETHQEKSGNPAEQTPQIDAWLEKHWQESDEKLIDGLIDFAQQPDKGLGEKSKALEHALNMINEAQYPKLDPVLKNKQTSPVLIRQIFDDMHNRGEMASIHASLKMLARHEPEVVEGARDFLAHFLDLDPESDLEALRMQAETRLLEMQEEKASDVVELPPDAPLPPLPPEMQEAPVINSP